MVRYATTNIRMLSCWPYRVHSRFFDAPLAAGSARLRGERVHSEYMLLAAEGDAVPHDYSMHLRELRVPSSFDAPLAAGSACLRGKRMHSD